MSAAQLTISFIYIFMKVYCSYLSLIFRSFKYGSKFKTVKLYKKELKSKFCSISLNSKNNKDIKKGKIYLN